MRQTPAVSKLEIMSANIGVAEPANPTPNVSVANWLWNGPDPTAVEAAFLKEQKAALAILAKVPTARLDDYVVDRHANGNLTVRPEAVFG